jgi:Gram-negative bacterial TonB protein C-terminal
MIAYIVALLFLAHQELAQRDPTLPSLCSPTRDISVSPSLDGGIDIKDPFFYASAASHSYAEIKFVNKLPKPIRTVTAVIDYIGPDGVVLVSILFQSSVDRPPATPQAKLHPEIVDQITELIQPGTEITLTGVSRITTATCPVASRPAFLELTFDDGSRLTRSLPDWSLPTTLMDSPFFLPPPPIGSLPISSASFRLNIDATGQVTSVTPTGRSEPSLFQYASEVLKNWIFYPALKNGQPVATELAILLRVNKQAEESFLTRQEAALPIVAIQVSPWSFDTQRWRAWYGDRPASTQSHFGQGDNVPHGPTN